MEVRKGRPEDALAVEGARVAGWRSGYTAIVPATFLDAMDPAAGEARWQAHLRDPGPRSVILVSVDDDVVTGFLDAGPSRDEPGSGWGEVRGCYVYPAAWGTGTADALMTAGLEHLECEGFDPVMLWCFRDNPRARAFYARHGFTHEGTDHVFDLQGLVQVPEVQLVRR